MGRGRLLCRRPWAWRDVRRGRRRVRSQACFNYKTLITAVAILDPKLTCNPRRFISGLRSLFEVCIYISNVRFGFYMTAMKHTRPPKRHTISTIFPAKPTDLFGYGETGNSKDRLWQSTVLDARPPKRPNVLCSGCRRCQIAPTLSSNVTLGPA